MLLAIGTAGAAAGVALGLPAAAVAGAVATATLTGGAVSTAVYEVCNWDNLSWEGAGSAFVSGAVDGYMWGGIGSAVAGVKNYVSVGKVRGNAYGESGSVNTPYGTAIQSNSKEAMQVKGYVEKGGMVYRGGTLNRSKTTDAQFWAPESPLTSGYADKYGVDFSQMDYIMGGYVKKGTEFITRPAPGLGNNTGGAIEIVTPPSSVDIKYFYMIGGQ